MTSSPVSSRMSILNRGLMCAVVVLFLWNGHILGKYRTVSKQLQQVAREPTPHMLPIGTTLPPLFGRNPTGESVTLIGNTSASWNVIVALTPGCSGCPTLLSFIGRVGPAAIRSDIRLVLLDPSETTTFELVDQHHLQAIPFIAQLPTELRAFYNVHAVPQMLRLHPDGRLVEVIYGAQRIESTLRRLITPLDPTGKDLHHR